MKKFLCTFLALIFLSTSAIAAVLVSTETPTLHFNGTTAHCEITIVSDGDYIEATLELRYGSQVLDAWSDSGMDYLIIDESYSPVTSGRGYSLRLYGSINGEPLEDITISGICP